jgi:hypothetical protein
MDVGEERQFPVLPSGRSPVGGRAEIPWRIVEPHAAQARRNHGQALEELAARGGLAWCELAAVLADRNWSAMPEGRAKLFCMDLAGLLPPDDLDLTIGNALHLNP